MQAMMFEQHRLWIGKVSPHPHKGAGIGQSRD